MSTMGDLDPIETGEWLDALSAVQQHRGGERSQLHRQPPGRRRAGAKASTCRGR